MLPSSHKPVIITVDDSPIILRTVSKVLSDVYKVYTLSKPAELGKVLQNLNPDLFILDFKMPGINGFDLIPVIKRFAWHQDTPIIFLTSEGTIDNVTAAIALGAQDFIVKPFRPDVLREKVSKHITLKEMFLFSEFPAAKLLV